MKVYISHVHADEKIARELARLLKADGFDVTYPSENLFPGDNWALEIGKALEKSDAMVVLLSPAAAKSEWVRRDVTFAIGNAQYEWRLIPVSLRPAKDVPSILSNLPSVLLADDIQSTAALIAERIRHPVKRFKRSAAASAA